MKNLADLADLVVLVDKCPTMTLTMGRGKGRGRGRGRSRSQNLSGAGAGAGNFKNGRLRQPCKRLKKVSQKCNLFLVT